MISIHDNFFEHRTFKVLQQYCKNEFFIKKAGEKEFLVLPTPENLYPFLEIADHRIILSFIRKAHKDFDTDHRIHCDGTIEGEKTSLASVLYINEKKGVPENGTMFWEHHKWAHRLPSAVGEKEFDRLLLEDANDLSKWEKRDVVHARPNRFLVYDSSLFHSKWPSKIEEGERIILVTFYAKV